MSSEETDLLEAEPVGGVEPSAEVSESEPSIEEREPMPPVESRFMFVDIAAMRAKQLRRGALPRITLPEDESERPESARKLERIAMREVDDGLIVYHLPSEDEDGDGEGGSVTEAAS